jgi:hypothetical protein
MDKEVGEKVKKWFDSLIKGQKNTYAGSHAFGFYNGEKIKLRGTSLKKAPGNKGTDGWHRLYLGFEKPQYPRTPKEIMDKIQVDHYDYYTRVYLNVQQANNNHFVKELTFDVGLHFYCNENGVEKKCRDTKITPFFDTETYFAGSDYLSKNNNRSIVGMYFKWKKHITKIEFTSANSNKKIYFEDFITQFKNDPLIMNSIKHRLVAIGMTKEQVKFAIGDGAGMGIYVTYGSDGKVSRINFDANRRSKGLVD